MRNSTLSQVGNTPFTPSVLESIFPNTKHISDKSRRLEEEGRIIRLKRGLYVRSTEDGALPVPFLIANHLYGPSYVSLQTALRHYGLIPERVFETQSMTIKHSREFDTPLGRYNYRNCNINYFPIGIRQEQEGNDNYMIATPEKALCDTLLKTAGILFSSPQKLEEYLVSDLRFEMEALKTFDTELLELCRNHAVVKAEQITHLIKLAR